MRSLTQKQARIVSFLNLHCQKFGYAPTVREICAHFGFRSPNSAQQHLNRLERKGVITRQPKLARAIVVREVG